MRKGLAGKQLVIAAVILAVVMAGIFGGITVLEQRENRAEQARLKAEAEKLSKNLWTDENTLILDGETYGFDHRIETFLFIGTDLGGGQPIGDSGKTRQPMADFLLLMILDHTNNSIGYIQIDRNTVTPVQMLEADGKVRGTRELQICCANWYGSDPEMAAENTVTAVKRYLGEMENIDGYYVISMRDIQLLNRAVGGVDITVEQDLTDADAAFTQGAQLHLTDEQAARFLHARMNMADETNAARMGRQRTYMAALFESVKGKCTEDPQFALELWDTLRSAAYTNMNGNDFSRIAQKLMKGENRGIHTIAGETKEGYIAEDDEVHEEFYPDMESLKAELTEMFSLVPAEEEEAEEEEAAAADEEDEEDWIDDEDWEEDDE